MKGVHKGYYCKIIPYNKSKPIVYPHSYYKWKREHNKNRNII